MAKKTYLIVTVDEYDLGSYLNDERSILVLSKEYLISHKQGKIPTSTNLLKQMELDNFSIILNYFDKFSSKDLNDLHSQLPENFSIKITEIQKIKGK